MAEDLVRYDLLVQDALRDLVRKVISDSARTGLVGEQHFYISFDTQAPGVRLSPRLREKYPEEMTVVIQHQFWDLTVTDHAFEVGLSFGNVPERLLVPFSAIKIFCDPSAQFTLQFEVAHEESEQIEAEDDAVETEPAPATATLDRRSPRGARSEPIETPASRPAPVDGKDGESQGAEVLSLDKFRKK